MIKITHLTSVHSRYDTRIFIKECTSLAKVEGYEVNLIVSDGLGDEINNNISIYDVGAREGGRISRMLKTVQKVFDKAKALNSDVYHLHDPELIPMGLKLKKLGKIVIFDAHEDLPKQLLGKPYLNNVTKVLLSKTFELYERYAMPKFDYIITATSYIKDKFIKINNNSINIDNFPILGELSNNTLWSEKKDEVCYVGGISEIRGIKEIVKAIGMTENCRLNLAGKFSEKDVESEVKSYDEWSSVNELGFLNRVEVADILSKSKAGIVTFYPLPNHIDAQPNKMFEYMSGRLPLIASNFPFWREVVEGNNCGLCVNPLDSKEIVDAITYIINNPKEAQEMGENGRKAVVEKYNWGVEEQKLYALYEELTK